jgi:hypothetical protein
MVGSILRGGNDDVNRRRRLKSVTPNLSLCMTLT